MTFHFEQGYFVSCLWNTVDYLIGVIAMIYFNSHVARDLLDLEELAEYPFWLAQYKNQMDFPHRVDLWQYTETGSVPGIPGDVDIDLMFIYE